MLSEKAFSEQAQRFEATSIRLEMAVVSEWIAREDRDPDTLYTIFVSPTTDGTVQTACSCLDGTVDRVCPHAFAVIRKLKSDSNLLDELLSQLFQRNKAAERSSYVPIGR